MPAGKQISDEALLQTLDYVLQKHTQASRGGRSHADFRFGNPEEGLESYAIPKGRLPVPGEKFLAVNTEIHPHGYMRFHGAYGRGKNRNKVEILESGKLDAKGDGFGKVLEIDEDAPRRRFRLVKLKNGFGDGWVLIGIDPAQTKTAAFEGCNFVSGRFLDCRSGKTLANLLIIRPFTAKALKKGMGGASGMPFGLGMLFDDCRAFWMKDVPFDLELVRLDDGFRITEIQKMKRSFLNLKLPVYRARRRESKHAIELPAGYCEEKGLKIGDVLEVGGTK